MLFILDQALHNTLVGEHGKHALYDYICWEYLLGKEQSPCVFTEEDLRNYTPGEATVHDNQYDQDPSLARDHFDRILTRWCFPPLTFVVEVASVLHGCLNEALKAAKWEVQHGNRFNGTEWDANKMSNNLFLELFHTVQEFYSDRKSPWSSMDEMDGFMAALPKLCEQTPDKLGVQEINALFGWNADKKYPRSSLCGELLKHLKGFVNTATHVFSELPERLNELKTRINAVAKNEGFTHFKPDDLWWFLEGGNAEAHRVHHVDRYDAMLNCSGESQGVKDMILDIKANRAQGRVQRFPDKFTTSMLLSGYAPGVLSGLVKKAQQAFQVKLEPFEISRLIRQIELDFIHGTLRKGEVIVSVNFPAIRTVATIYVNPEVRQREGVESEESKLDRAMVPSTDVSQPSGTDLRKSKVAKEEEGSMVPIIIGACAVLGFIALR